MRRPNDKFSLEFENHLISEKIHTTIDRSAILTIQNYSDGASRILNSNGEIVALYNPELNQTFNSDGSFLASGNIFASILSSEID